MEGITKPNQTVMIDPNEPLILPDGTALTGRIEWFLYSLCLLDYENLPTPMSRIEQFANALVTGEVPNIEPQSRVEEYFLAILTGDVENLPEPESRVEVLLNKLARGEFDLSDVEPIQSRYELLIAYLIKNSGIGDITYVLHEFLASETPYTMYNTQEKPTKSAILKGQTLVNLVQPYLLNYTLNLENTDAPMRITDSEIIIDWSKNLPFNAWIQIRNDTNPILQSLKENTEYTCVMTLLENTPTINGEKYTGDTVMIRWWLQGFGSTDFSVKQHEQGKIKFKFNTGNKGQTEYMMLGFYIWGTSSNGTKTINGGKMRFSKEIMIIEGDYTNVDIPFFTGMQSVKMPVLTTCGENLFDGETERGFIDFNTGNNSNAWNDLRSVGYTEVIGGNKINIYVTNSGWTSPRIFEYDKAKNFIKSTGEYSVVLDNATKFVRFNIGGNTDVDGKSQVMLYYGEANSSTTYEPYKSNILTVNEEVELRGVGGVKDTLDCLTGEVISLVEEVVLDGSESWVKQHFTDGYTMFRHIVSNLPTDTSYRVGSVLCDKFNVENYINTQAQSREFITIRNGTTGQLLLNVSNAKASEVEELKEWLSLNPITVQYPLKEKSIKTVDLSILDQDGATVEKLNTFKDITHVSCSVDEGSIYPYVEMEVATSNDEDLAAIGLKLEEKNKVQSKLIKVNDYQSDIIDNVMLGITEIYESI